MSCKWPKRHAIPEVLSRPLPIGATKLLSWLAFLGCRHRQGEAMKAWTTAGFIQWFRFFFPKGKIHPAGNRWTVFWWYFRGNTSQMSLFCIGFFWLIISLWVHSYLMCLLILRCLDPHFFISFGFIDRGKTRGLCVALGTAVSYYMPGPVPWRHDDGDEGDGGHLDFETYVLIICFKGMESPSKKCSWWQSICFEIHLDFLTVKLQVSVSLSWCIVLTTCRPDIHHDQYQHLYYFIILIPIHPTHSDESSSCRYCHDIE